MWLAMRGALATGGGASVKRVSSNYHIPISNTATAVLALETT
jgi:protocatechuate 4,5-dioxygenase beta chain